MLRRPDILEQVNQERLKNTDTSSEKKTAEWFKKPEYLVIALF